MRLVYSGWMSVTLSSNLCDYVHADSSTHFTELIQRMALICSHQLLAEY